MFLFTGKDAADKKPDEDKLISETLKSNLTDSGRSFQVSEAATAPRENQIVKERLNFFISACGAPS